MSTEQLLVSNMTSAIHDEDESRFVVLGEIVWDFIPALEIIPGKMIEPGEWKFILRGDSKVATQYHSSGRNKAFRVVRGNGKTCSTEGFYLQFPSPLGDGTFELTIKASGERVETG